MKYLKNGLITALLIFSMILTAACSGNAEGASQTDPVSDIVNTADTTGVVPEQENPPADTLASAEDTTAEETTTAASEETTALETTAPVTTAKSETTAKAEDTTVPAPTVVTKVTLDKTELALKAGEKAAIAAFISPADAKDKVVVWSSSNAKVAAVSNNGTVTAVSGGTAVITAQNSSGAKASCAVTVTDIPVTAVILDKETLSLEVGAAYTFTPRIAPADATNKNVSLTSSNTAVVAVSNFQITAKGAGTALITAKSASGAAASCTVTVTVPSVTTAPETTKAPETTQNPNLPQVKKPIYTGQSAISQGTICITGTTEIGSTLTVTGEGIESFTVTPQEKRFFFSVKLPAREDMVLYVSAAMTGMRASEPTKIEVKYATTRRDVVVGELSQLHYPYTLNDFYGNNLFKEAELKALSRNADKRLEKVQELSGNSNAKVIYLLAPNSLTVYPESARMEWKAKKISEDNRRKQFIRMINEKKNPNIIAVDVLDYMMQNKDKGKLYLQTDTHWNTFGAYFAYFKLMEAIATDFPNAAPYGLEKFNVTSGITGGGDLVNFLGIPNDRANEFTYFCNLKGASRASLTNVNDLITSTVSADGLPTAVVMRDSFGGALHQFLIEHFAKLVYTPFGSSYPAAVAYCEEHKPDYFIQILVERNTGTLLDG